jgi:hypothetical protein
MHNGSILILGILLVDSSPLPQYNKRKTGGSRMNNDFLIDFLVEQLNKEMKNIAKSRLTNKSQDDIINVSNEREVTSIENRRETVSIRH